MLKTEEIIEQTKLYFGKDKELLREKILSFEFDGKDYRDWRKKIKQVTAQPFDVQYGIMKEVVDKISDQKTEEIDWGMIGNLSWEFKILLNPGMDKGYDWDKKLATKCQGTARVLQIYASDLIPCYVVDTFYMSYNHKKNYYEFGPLSSIEPEEQKEISKIKQLFQNEGFVFLEQEISLEKYQELYSDIHTEGNASLFDVLFSDQENYQRKFERFNARDLKDATGKKISWREFYTQTAELEYRLEYRYYTSGNVLCTSTDKDGRIFEVKVWKDIEGEHHKEFTFSL